MSTYAAYFVTSSPRSSFQGMSEDMNAWSDSGIVGATLGYAAFGAAYLFTVAAIFMDMDARGKLYDEMIKDDLAQLRSLGLENKMNEYEAELKISLAGKKEETSGDDMLMGEAAKLTSAQYSKHM